MEGINRLFEFAARLDRMGIVLTRVALVVVLVWDWRAQGLSLRG